MSKVSNEIRNWCDLCGGIIDSYDRDKLGALIERVDAELVELLKDADGIPIHLGDTVYLDDGRKAEVRRIQLSERGNIIVFTVCVVTSSPSGQST